MFGASSDLLHVVLQHSQLWKHRGIERPEGSARLHMTTHTKLVSYARADACLLVQTIAGPSHGDTSDEHEFRRRGQHRRKTGVLNGVHGPELYGHVESQAPQPSASCYSANWCR